MGHGRKRPGGEGLMLGTKFLTLLSKYPSYPVPVLCCFNQRARYFLLGLLGWTTAQLVFQLISVVAGGSQPVVNQVYSTLR